MYGLCVPILKLFRSLIPIIHPFLSVAGGMAVFSHPKMFPILPAMHQFALVAGYTTMYCHPKIVPFLSIRPPIFVRNRFYGNVFPLYALSRTFYIGDRLQGNIFRSYPLLHPLQLMLYTVLICLLGCHR